LNSAILLQDNEIGETKGLVSRHVCIVQIRNSKKKYVIMSHYRLVTTLLKNKVKIFRNANIREIPFDVREKDDDWIRVNAGKGTWVGSFGGGFIEK
jgi:hypothetical protein